MLERLTKVVIDGNGQPGLVTRMALMEKSIEGACSVASAPQQPTIKKDQNYTEIENKWLGKLRTNDPVVQNGLRIFVILVGIAALVFMLNHMNDTRQMMLEKLSHVEKKVE